MPAVGQWIYRGFYFDFSPRDDTLKSSISILPYLVGLPDVLIAKFRPRRARFAFSM